jgi:predicted ribosomally synthesized peptide with SipW-like signal peptide
MKKITAICAASVLAVIMIASVTFAWFTAKDSVTNHLESPLIADGSVNLVEVFTPTKEWLPGQEIKKQVAVANNGSGTVFVRVSFEELMEKLNVPAEPQTNSIDQRIGTKIVPQIFNAKPYLETPWVEVTDQFTEIKGLPEKAGLTLRMRAESGVGGKTSYSFVFLYKIPSGDYKDQYQRVTADFDVSKNVLTIDSIQYWDFGEALTTAAAWADNNLNKTSANPDVRSASNIGFPATDAADKKISLNYTDLTKLTGATPTADSWWYSPTDGFFYYIAPLPAGAVTPFLLDNLKLDSSAGEKYSGMKFDLLVHMQAIQNTSEALLASDGWGLTATHAVYNALKGFCDPPVN